MLDVPVEVLEYDNRARWVVEPRGDGADEVLSLEKLNRRRIFPQRRGWKS